MRAVHLLCVSECVNCEKQLETEVMGVTGKTRILSRVMVIRKALLHD